MSFFSELRRRNVYRVAAAYLVVAWLLMQISDVVLGNIAAPGWIFQVLMLFLAIGLPIAMVFAWAFEMTPDGLRRERDVARSKPVAQHARRKLDRIIIGLLAVAVVYFVGDKWLWNNEQTTSDPPATLEKSIAVLPFSNRSAIVEDVHFVDGIHDDILTQLAKLSSLDKVISRTSTEQYRKTGKPILQIGQELGVATILVGAVQRAGNRVRINVQLINAATDEHLWAETFDREFSLENLFEIQTEIAREVVSALHGVLTSDDEKRLAAMPTEVLEAYEQFVLGRREMGNRTSDSLAKAKAHFEKAIELDPEYALAYVGLANSIGLQVQYTAIAYEESIEPRQRNIDKALSLDPLMGEAYAALGFLLYEGGDWEDAEDAYRKAIELAPNYASGYHFYSVLLRRIDDRREESLPLLRKAISLDPAAPILISSLADNLFFLGRMEEVETVLLRGIEQHPRFPKFHLFMGSLRRIEGRLGEATVWLERTNELDPSNFGNRLYACNLYLHLDDPDAAERCFEGLRADFSEFPEATLAGLVNLKVGILFVRGDAHAAVEYAREVASGNADPSLQGPLAVAYLMNAEYEKARPLLEMLTPKFYMEGEVTVSQTEVASAINAAATMREGDGWSQQAHYLAGQALETMRSMHRIRGVSYGFLDVPAHGIREEWTEMVSALRAAIDDNWRTNWWTLRTPGFEGMLAGQELQSEWESLIRELEADAAEQRQWYKNHKNDPLF